MKSLLSAIIFCQIFVIGLMGGYTYLLHKQGKRSDLCMKEILDSNVQLKDYFGHKIEPTNIWPHAQSYIANHYLFCMNRSEDE